MQNAIAGLPVVRGRRRLSIAAGLLVAGSPELHALRVIGSGGWGTDYPAASNFFDAKFSCRVYRPANPFNNNDSEFCNRRIEAQANRARLLGLTNPPAANRAWERVYRDIIDQAPWLPTVTPTWTDFISKRAGNYQFHPLWGILIDQLWIR